MKYLLTESKLKSLLKDKFDVDFTGKIEMVTSVYPILNDFGRCLDQNFIRKRLNNNGPMYIISLDTFDISLSIYKQKGKYRNYFLYQKNSSGNGYYLMDFNCQYYMDFEFMDLIGIKVLGLSMERFIDLYLDSE
jgi:hypothetical protein